MVPPPLMVETVIRVFTIGGCADGGLDCYSLCQNSMLLNNTIEYHLHTKILCLDVSIRMCWLIKLMNMPLSFSGMAVYCGLESSVLW